MESNPKFISWNFFLENGKFFVCFSVKLESSLTYAYIRSLWLQHSYVSPHDQKSASKVMQTILFDWKYIKNQGIDQTAFHVLQHNPWI